MADYEVTPPQEPTNPAQELAQDAQQQNRSNSYAYQHQRNLDDRRNRLGFIYWGQWQGRAMFQALGGEPFSAGRLDTNGYIRNGQSLAVTTPRGMAAAIGSQMPRVRPAPTIVQAVIRNTARVAILFARYTAETIQFWVGGDRDAPVLVTEIPRFVNERTINFDHRELDPHAGGWNVQPNASTIGATGSDGRFENYDLTSQAGEVRRMYFYGCQNFYVEEYSGSYLADCYVNAGYIEPDETGTTYIFDSSGSPSGHVSFWRFYPINYLSPRQDKFPTTGITVQNFSNTQWYYTNTSTVPGTWFGENIDDRVTWNPSNTDTPAKWLQYTDNYSIFDENTLSFSNTRSYPSSILGNWSNEYTSTSAITSSLMVDFDFHALSSWNYGGSASSRILANLDANYTITVKEFTAYRAYLVALKDGKTYVTVCWNCRDAGAQTDYYRRVVKYRDSTQISPYDNPPDYVEISSGRYLEGSEIQYQNVDLFSISDTGAVIELSVPAADDWMAPLAVPGVIHGGSANPCINQEFIDSYRNTNISDNKLLYTIFDYPYPDPYTGSGTTFGFRAVCNSEIELTVRDQPISVDGSSCIYGWSTGDYRDDRVKVKSLGITDPDEQILIVAISPIKP